MHDRELLVEGIRLRLDGHSVKSIAKTLDVSVGWASENLGRIEPRTKPSRDLRRANNAQMEADGSNWSRHRLSEWQALNEHKRTQRMETIEELRRATCGFKTLPEHGSKPYKRLDQLQQLYKKDAGAGVFHGVAVYAPELLEHIVGWASGNGYKPQDKTDERFVAVAMLARDHVIKHLQPPSHASKAEDEIAAARWLGRWAANARGRGERKKNVARAELMIKIADIVDGLRSKHAAVNGPAVEAVQNGTWAKLFDQVVATKNSYIYEPG